MGVRGLQTFLETYCPSACYPVKIAEKAHDYKKETGKEPVIVIDAQSCYSLWCKGLDWVIGFEIQEFLYRLRIFMQSFKNIGVKIVFFFGGSTVEKKREVWIARRLRNMRDVFAVFDFLEKGNLSKDIPGKYESLPPTMGIFTSFILKYVLGCEVYMSVRECDEEIIEYAEKHDCFAIFAQDSDFIVSDVKSCVLSSKSFDISTMRTLIYDRVELAKILRIQVDQLPLLAILAGNDLIDHEIIKGFHCSLCLTNFERFVPFDMLMPALGEYINSLPDVPIEQQLEKICVDMFTNTSKLKLIRSSYNSYFALDTPRITDPDTKWSRILRIARYRHRNNIVPNTIWSVLKDQVFELSMSFEDLRRSSDRTCSHPYLSSATILRLLRQRLYGILLYEYENPPIHVEEWCGENVKSYQKSVRTEIAMPLAHHPGLLVLWSDNNGQRVNSQKWKLFLTSISPNITNISEWLTLTEDLIAVTAALYYLFEQEFMSGYEMYAVMATVATYPLFSREKLNSMHYGAPHFRSVHISVAVIRAFSTVITLMAACGYPVPVSSDLIYLKFEAKLFQIKYKEMKQRKTYQELCENDKSCLDTFYQMKTILGKATRKGVKKERKRFNGKQ